ncbi:MAG TPA: hypothetical protein VGO59_02655 [Verrucomicrobiae bacterium]
MITTARLLLFGAACLFWVANAQAGESDWVPLKLKLPAPVDAGTPKNLPPGSTVELNAKPEAPPLMPPDARNVAPGKRITSSDKNATASDLAKLADGDKEAEENGIVQLRKGLQWVQFDLNVPHEIYAVAFWHAFDTHKIFHSVAVQVADDADFTENVRTLFNNDRENSAGLGIGADRQYMESNLGKVVDAKGARARYVRLYSNGSSDSKLNEYIEVEIYGRPAK